MGENPKKGLQCGKQSFDCRLKGQRVGEVNRRGAKNRSSEDPHSILSL